MVCVYDSGVGGLTALAALRRAAPLCNVLYLGDTARVPYGTRDAATVCRYAQAALSYLSAYHPSAVLVACGTVSTVFLPSVPQGLYRFPLFGVAEAGVRAAVAAAPHGRVAVLGTEATVRGGYFARRLREEMPHASVTSLACPLFVSLAECGLVARGDPIPAMAVERMLAPLIPRMPEVILLGCTHFPWLAPHIAHLFPEAALIDCGEAAVRELTPLLAGEGGEGRTEYLVTEGAEAFGRFAARMTGHSLGDAIREITLPI
ncbi:MAG: glutamate racemase [Clostridia bacterium]|nr:glutamate racemase [Clostridia bacterium]